MNNLNRSAFFLAATMLAAQAIAKDVVQVDLNSTARKYCHILALPSAWKLPTSVQVKGEVFATRKFSLVDDYEFRVPDLQGAKFLIRGVQQIVNDFYSINVYEADFSDRKAAVQAVNEDTWQLATVVGVRRDNSGLGLVDPASKYVEFQGRRFARSGDFWGRVNVSPDQATLVIQSWSGILGRCGGNNDLLLSPCIELGGPHPHGNLFFDVYNARTALKVITLTAEFRKIHPDEALDQTRWVTNRYFVVPLDEKRERSLACDFGGTK